MNTSCNTRVATITKMMPVVMAFRLTKTNKKTAQSREVSDSEICSHGGKIDINGDVDDSTGIGQLYLSYVECKIDEVTVNGDASLVVHSTFLGSYEPNSYTLKYLDLSIEVNSETFTTTGKHEIETSIDETYGRHITTIDSDVYSNSNGFQTLYENLRTVEKDADSSITIIGRMYHGEYGYIDVESIAPLIFQSVGDKFPSGGGPLIAKGAGTRELKVTPFSDSLYVNLDLDGIEGYELSGDISVSSTGFNIPDQASNTNPSAEIVEVESMVRPGNEVKLDAFKSTDVDNDLIRYQWTLESKPSDSQVVISSNSTELFFTPDVTGAYRITLTVIDSNNAKDTKTLSFNALSEPILLGHSITDAEYVKSIDKIVAISSSPNNSLRVINPETGVSEQVTFINETPVNVSISPNEKSVAIAFENSIGFYSLDDIAQEKTFDIPISPLYGDGIQDVVIDNGDLIYFSYIGKLYTLNPNSGSLITVEDTFFYDWGNLKIQPQTSNIYLADILNHPSDVHKFDATQNPPTYKYDSPYHGDYDFDGDLWFTSDGKLFLAASGNLFHTSELRTEDMLYKDSIDSSIFYLTHTKITHADHSSQKNSFITTVTDIEPYTRNVTEIRSYSLDSLKLESSIRFDDFSLDNNEINNSEALFAFYDGSGMKSYIIAKSIDITMPASNSPVVKVWSAKDMIDSWVFVTHADCV
ncbi:hypothetical protein GQR58_020353 [Nymphon striatum]|nr:hypothetical protein GQR58_020353 [Nymphon striatum]